MNTMSLDQKAKAVRDLWRFFEESLISRRRIMERQCDEIFKALDVQWRATPARARVKQADHDAQKRATVRDVRESYYQKVREDWQTKLRQRGLKDEDWGNMSLQEAIAIEQVMQDAEEEEERAVFENVFTQPQLFSVPNPAPPLSSTARSTNTSTSSYTFVSPTDFTTDDELYDAVAAYVSTDDSEDEHGHGLPLPGGWGPRNGMGPHAVPSNNSSQTGSPDQSPPRAFEYFPGTSAHTRPHPSSGPPKRPPDMDTKPSKTRLRGPPYVGPRLSDTDESTDEEADFERFKMEIRVRKIIEFHLRAAQADVELALALYNARATKTSLGKADDAAKVAEHEKQMLKLQAAKEEERKNIVAAERKKRRDEIKKRSTLREPARAANAPTTATANEAQPRWNELFNAEQLHIDVNPNRTLALRKEDDFQDDTQTDNQTWETSPLDPMSSRVPAPAGPIEALRGRKQSLGRATPSGWKAKQVPSVAPTQSTWQAEPSPPTADSETTPSWLSEAMTGLTDPIDHHTSFDTQDIHFPGGFPAEVTSAPVPPLANGWKKAAAPSAASMMFKTPPQPDVPVPSTSAWGINSKTNAAKTSPTPPVVVESKPEKSTPSPAVSASNKKLNKKQQQRLAAQKKGAIGTSSKVEEEDLASPDTPTVATKVLSSKDMLLQQALAQSHEDVSSTPRPHLFAPQMKRSGGLMADYASDAAPTPRVSNKRLENPFGMSLGAGSSSLGMGGAHTQDQQEEEASIWAKGMRQMGHAKSKSIGGAAEEPQGTVWEQAMKAKLQGQVQPQPEMRQRSALGKNAAIFGMPGDDEHSWGQTIKAKAQVGGHQSLMTMQGIAPPPPAVPEETPWERMQRLKAEAAAGAAAPTEQPTISRMAAPNANPWADLDRPVSKLVQQPQSVPADLYWTPNGGTSAGSKHPQIWNPNAHLQPRATSPPLVKQSMTMPPAPSYAQNPYETYRVRRMSDPVSPSPRGFGHELPKANQTAVPASILNMSKAKKATKSGKVTIEEVPDEEGPSGWKVPADRLPSDSRIILDIVEPKPSVPSTVFTNIFHYGEGEEEYDDEEYEPGFNSTVPTPSTAPTSPPDEVPSLDEDWFASAAEEMKNGNWDSLLGGAGSFSGNVASSTSNATQQQQKSSPWATVVRAKESPSSSQSTDGAKFVSALQSVDKGSPPAVVPKPSPPKPAAPAVTPPAPVAVESKEPAKPNNQPKGKAKGKGKGRR